MNDIPRTDPELRKALAREAEELLANRAFQAAILALRQVWHAEQMLDATSNKKAKMLRAKMMALEAIPQQLAVFINNEKMAPRGQQRA